MSKSGYEGMDEELLHSIMTAMLEQVLRLPKTTPDTLKFFVFIRNHDGSVQTVMHSMDEKEMYTIMELALKHRDDPKEEIRIRPN